MTASPERAGTFGAVGSPDDDEFARLVEPHRRELRVHCYRMLGSASDCDDLVQDTMLRAWRARGSLRDATTVRAWLYRIATNLCLDELARRPRRALAFELGPAADPAAPLAPAADEPIYVEPAPDVWLSDASTPSAAYSRRESITLAFVAALQSLTPLQRAVLLLRDVVELSAEETSEVLDLSTSAANSALFRAREALPVQPSMSLADIDRDRLARYVRAFETNDTQALVALLRDDVRTTMPPSPTWIDGRAANAEFYRGMFGRLWPGAVRLVPTSANGQPAFGFYRAASRGQPLELRAIQLLTVVEHEIAQIDHFMMPSLGHMFGLVETLAS
jgi:RNA polymerase sigma-70 factor, ECF subfamily